MEIANYISVPLDALKEYAHKTQLFIQSQTATETSYYENLIHFLEQIFSPKKGYLIQTGFRTSNSNNKPDITVSFNGVAIFHIEAKPPETPIETLVTLESFTKQKQRFQDQIFRYRSEGIQLLITDFMDVWLIDPMIPNQIDKEQEFSFKCSLLQKKNSQIVPAVNAVNDFEELLSRTCEDYLLTISNVKSLIHPLSNIAKQIRKKAITFLTNPLSTFNHNQIQDYTAKYLRTIRDDFKKSIFKEEMENEDEMFADLYAQTIVYGSFSAWIKFCQKGNKPENFNIQNVGDFLPFGSFLRSLFVDLKNKTPSEFQSIFHEMELKFQKTEYRVIMSNIETLITTFYSDFLKLYDPITSKDRGVVYTPYEIVEFMIHGIDFMFKQWLGKPDGIISLNNLENPNKHTNDKNHTFKKAKLQQGNLTKTIDMLRILDPAAGTMAFASGLLHVARQKFYQKFSNSLTLAQGAFETWVKNEFFQNTFAFEILMAPYVLGHIRTFLTLEELGVKLNAEEYRLNSYLMNTLMTPPNQSNIDNWMFNNQDIGREIKEALKIRDKRDIFVVMGNPPYNLSSQNNCEWINEKILDYKKDLHEKNQKILADDYVKFMRFAQWKIEQVGTGVLALITNSRYLEGQMFSVMRKSLRSTFDHIYIINLHGDMRKKESGNPFDIRVGVAISIMVRVDNSPNKSAAVHYMDVPESTREEKFAKLAQGFKEENFILLPETKKNYFVEIDTRLMSRYEQFIPINEFFKKSPTSGVMVGRDHLLMDVDKKNLETNISKFFLRDFKQLQEWNITIKDTKSWKIEKVFAKTDLETVKNSIQMFQYRGWDFRYLAYERNIVEGHRMGYIDQISFDNPAITVTKSSRKKQFCTAFVTNHILEKCYMSVTDTAYAFPLKIAHQSNIICPKFSFNTTDSEFFAYIYAIMFAKTYRKRYDAYLRKGYPRIPITNSAELYRSIVELGQNLISSHLLDIKIDPQFELSVHPPEAWIISDFSYDASSERIYFSNRSKIENNINKKQICDIPYIEGITTEIWAYSIGNIPQLEQFLKSRKYSSVRKWNSLQRPITHEELLYFLKICTAIKFSIALEEEIDNIYRQIDLL